MRTFKATLHLLRFAATLLLFETVQAQTTAHFGNFAPRDASDGGTVTLVAGDVVIAHDISYGTLVQGLSLPTGAVSLTILDQNGEIIAQRDTRLLVDATYTLYVAGNGVGRELELRIVRESVQPLRTDRYAMQYYSAALHPVNPLRYYTECNLVLRSGTLTFGLEHIGRTNYPFPSTVCSTNVRVGNEQSPIVTGTSFISIRGGLQRLVLMGDGEHQAYELRVFEGIERAAALVEPDTRMDGLWFDPSDTGSGVTLMVEEREDGIRWVTGVLYGYNSEGAPAWALIEGQANQFIQTATLQGMQVLESVGGTPQGDRHPVRMNLGIASLDFHSCREATLYLFTTNERMPQRLGRKFDDGPEQLFRLQRLLPLDACLLGGVILQSSKEFPP